MDICGRRLPSAAHCASCCRMTSPTCDIPLQSLPAFAAPSRARRILPTLLFQLIVIECFLFARFIVALDAYLPCCERWVASVCLFIFAVILCSFSFGLRPFPAV